MEKKFNGKKFDELLKYVDFFTEGNKPPFFKKKDDKKEKPADKKEKKGNPFAAKGKKDTKKPKVKKAAGKGKGKVPPGLAAYLAKKRGGKNDSKSED